MATIPSTPAPCDSGYPTSDGRPAAETDWHRDLMVELIRTLKHHFTAQPRVYVSGNLLLFYERGNRRRHVSPDVFVVRGVANHNRRNYLLWEERRAPQVVIELTSSSTRNEDLRTKFTLYQDTLKVREYFLFDPRGDYLEPPLQGHRLRQGVYRPIRLQAGRLPSQVLGLHLEGSGGELRLYDPAAGCWLPTLEERIARAEAARQQAEAARQQAEAARHETEATLEQVESALEQSEAARQQAEAARQQVEAALEESEATRQQVEAEFERLRQELAELRRRSQGP